MDQKCGFAERMVVLDLIFVIFCSLCGGLGGYGIWTTVAKGPAPGFRPLAGKTQTVTATSEGSPPSKAAKPVLDPASVAELKTQLAEVIRMLGDAQTTQKKADDQLLDEIRAIVSAQDPIIRERLDQITNALGVEKDGTTDTSAADDSVDSSLDTWRAELQGQPMEQVQDGRKTDQHSGDIENSDDVLKGPADVAKLSAEKDEDQQNTDPETQAADPPVEERVVRQISVP